MIDKEIFRKTEKKLYNYFRKDKKIGSLNHKIEILNKQIDDIEKRLKNINITIPEESRSITYEERVQTSSDGISYAERTAIRITDNLLKEQFRKFEEITQLEEELRDIEADNIIIEDNINDLSEEDKHFLKLKYSEGKKDWQVGKELGMSQSTATRSRQRLIENVVEWEE
ncbi:hypothetical protein [Clostridium ganghwense]|uniref:Sigma-70 family RNA polymerase sigma factor n=1 Tax=Clostridium ganghwense TaxID=312089 RepID=A0ABT4CTP6_9CLOT|nr:hypothetical protein [Clostridium ganghwense]MCY6372440.1 hypothetical protein [Clostridium ganghwense]